MRAWYRVRQFWQALTAQPPRRAPLELAPGLQELFVGMPRADRAHALHTYERLAARAAQPLDLITAALLHDVGKSRPQIHLWDRVLFVLAGRLAPGWLSRATAQTVRWAGLAALQDHAEEGARLAAAAGGTPRMVALIRHHHAEPGALPWPEEEQEILRALQAADEQS